MTPLMLFCAIALANYLSNELKSKAQYGFAHMISS